jgi:hypothetical protein
MVRAPWWGLIDGDREFEIPDFDRFPGLSRRNAAARLRSGSSAVCFVRPFDRQTGWPARARGGDPKGKQELFYCLRRPIGD